jgi:hypothetical protein
MGESFDHCPAGWIRQSRECCTQIIHNHMVVHCLVNVKCALIQGADHMYSGQEDRVAQVIASLADTLLSANSERSGTPKNP